MRFNTKDLMVSVVPGAAAKVCALHTTICFSPTLQCFNHSCGFVSCGFATQITCGGACSVLGSIGCNFGNSCGAGGSACDPTQFGCPGTWFQIENPADLVTLKDELTAVVKQLETFQKEGLPTQLKTKAEADQMEAALNAALEQVRAEKTKLK